jgi:hypothetical protein
VALVRRQPQGFLVSYSLQVGGFANRRAFLRVYHRLWLKETYISCYTEAMYNPIWLTIGVGFCQTSLRTSPIDLCRRFVYCCREAIHYSVCPPQRSSTPRTYHMGTRNNEWLPYSSTQKGTMTFDKAVGAPAHGRPLIFEE